MNDHRPSFSQLGLGALLIAFIAALYGLRPGGDAGKPAEKPAAAPAPAVAAFANGAGSEPHRQFVLDFLYPRKVPATAPETAVDPEGKSKPLRVATAPMQRFRSDKADKIVCLVVTVADPVDTPFGFWFDQIVESMTRAAGAFNYSPAGHWFPWELHQRGLGNAGLKSDDENRPLFELYPGVMLFRHQDPTRTMVVLLVGETVNGIRADALKRALNLVQEIDRARTKHDDRIRLVAPFFSGAQAGLFQAMAEWADGATGKDLRTFDVISGSANAIDLSIAKKEKRPPSPLELFKQDHRCTFRSTIVPWEIQQAAVLNFLTSNKRHWQSDAPPADVNLSNVAILIESNTGFGGRQRDHPSGGAAAHPETTSPLYLTFPMRLARVQARYAQQRAQREKRVALGDVWLPVEGQTQSPRLNPDMAPTLDEATTPRLDDRGIDDITATIRRYRIDYVGLSATDPQDVVFLVERIKRDCPNVQIFVMGMDLIYALPENRNTMRGVVIGSTYPLYPPNQEWTNPHNRVRQTFMSESAQGCYNAAVFHLRDAVQARGNPAHELQEYAPPAFAEPNHPATNWLKPPVWVFTMGENGHYVPNDFYFYWSIPTPAGPPIAAEASDELMAAVRASDGRQAIRGPAIGAYAVPVALLLLGAGGVLRWVTARRSTIEVPPCPTLLTWDGWQKIKPWWNAPMGTAEQCAATWQNLALAVILVGMVPVLTTGFTLLGPDFHDRPWLRVVFLTLGCAAALLMLLIGVLLQVRLLLRLAKCRTASAADRSRARWRLACNGLMSLTGWTLASWMLAGWWTAEQSSRVLFAERATLVQTGYSVMPPLLLLAAGLVALSYSALRRQELDTGLRIDCPYPDGIEEAVDPLTARTCRRLRQETGELREELASLTAFGSRRLRWLVVAGIASVLVAWPFWCYRRPTYEGRVWDTTFLLAFVVLTCAAILNTMRLLTCWQGLERLLHAMALLPMAHAFDRVPRMVADLFGGAFWTRRPRSSHLVIPLSILRQLRSEAQLASSAHGLTTTPREADAAGPALARLPLYDECPAAIADDLDRAAAWPGPHEIEAMEESPVGSLNTLSHDAQDVIRHLARYWPHHSIGNAFGDEPADAGGKEASQSSPQMTAPTTLHQHGEDEQMPCWVQKAEDFVAVQAVTFLSQFFIHLRELAACAVCGSVLLLLAATVYPFQPEQLIMYLVLAVLFGVAGSIVWVLVRANKNEIISRINRSTPNRFELNWTFISGMLQYVGPIVLVILVSLSGRMRTLVEPLLNLIH